MTMAFVWKTGFLITALMNKHLRFTNSGQCQSQSTPFRVGCIICDYLAKKRLQFPLAPQEQILSGETPVSRSKLCLQCREIIVIAFYTKIKKSLRQIL